MLHSDYWLHETSAIVVPYHSIKTKDLAPVRELFWAVGLGGKMAKF
jgi:hypothetical protein